MTSHFSVTRATMAFLAVLALILAPSAEAQTTGKIAGTVTDASNGEGLPGVNVVIVETTTGGVTDADGDYFILNISPGSYDIQASSIGFTTTTVQNVEVHVDQTTTIDFDLTEEVIEGEEVIVTAERPLVERDVTGSVHRLNAEALSRTPIQNIDDILAQQTGVYNTGYTAYLRGGVQSEVNYQVDGTSLNSGLISDNWQRLNTTSIQEVSVLTGGYNAEYGNAMSGVVNVVTHEPSAFSRHYSGALNYRVRPSGQYHWGDNMYSEDLWKYTNFGMSYWQTQLETEANRNSYAEYFRRFYGWDGTRVPTADELLNTYRQQITPSDVLANYAERMQHEVEGSIWGSPMDHLTFLVSGRYKRGVNIYPQSNAYNPEYNVQAKLGYHFSPGKKLTLNVTNGWYHSSTVTESNWNNTTTSQEARWQPNADVRDPYVGSAYAPWGGYWLKGPEEKNFNVGTLKWDHTLSPRTFYTVSLSYLRDYTTSLQEYDKLNTSTETVRWGDSWFDLAGNFRLEARQIQVNNYSDSRAWTAQADITSQVHKSHQVKAGAELKLYDVDYQHYYMEFPAGDVWHLDNVFDGEPAEAAIYVQDKMEYEGIVLNVGVRFDAFNARTMYSPNIFDPLLFQTHNGGDGTHPTNIAPIWQAHRPGKDWFAFRQDFRDAFPDNWENMQTVSSEWKMAISPRLGLSFPITENSKLRFSYGHFNQRPSWVSLMGFPTSWYDASPYATVRMDQWQGWYGHPGLSYDRTIQYELGFTQNFFDFARLDLAAYYKDASRLTRYAYNGTYNRNGGGFASSAWGAGNSAGSIWSKTRNIANDGHDNIFYTNNAFKDIRGIEIVAEKLFTGRWSARAAFDFSTTTGGRAGYSQYREDGSTVNQPHSYDELKATWLSSYVMKGNVSYVTPQSLAMGVLGDITVGMYHEYFAGPQYTYYPTDYQGVQAPNNRRWFPHHRTDLTFNKQVSVGSFRPVIGVEVFNLFNYKDKILLSGDNLERWEESGELPKITKSGEDNLWFFYNSVSNPRRMIYFTMGLKF